MLEMRPSCECCDRDLPVDAPGAMICTFECTVCLARVASVAGVLRDRCPNRGGEFVARPLRPAAWLVRMPASTKRVFKPEGCGPTA